MPNDDIMQSPDKKYYGSGNTSALGNQPHGDGRGVPGEARTSLPTSNIRSDDLSSDKYYASGGSRQSPNDPGRKVPLPGQAYADAPDITRPVRIASIDGVAAGRDSIVLAFKSGAEVVIVEVGAGVESYVRTQLDLLVARETLSQGQLNAIRFRPLPTTLAQEVKQSFGDVDKRVLPVVSVDADPDNELPTDFEAFVKGGDPVVANSPSQEADTFEQAIDAVVATATGHPIGAFDNIGMPENTDAIPSESPTAEVEIDAADDTDD